MFPIYPYHNIEDFNLDWIIRLIKKLEKEVDTFTALTKITWAGEWDITKYYTQWSLVDDNGNGYISIKPVPRNVPITDSNYWVLVADYSALYAAFSQRITNLENAVDTINNTIIPAIQGDITTLDNSINLINIGVKNVKQFGAVGDGVTDDTQAFIDCFDGGGFIIIPKGDYLITNRVDIKSNTIIYGIGTLLARMVDPGNLSDYTALLYGDKVNNVILNNITIEGTGALSSLSSSAGYWNCIMFEGGNNITIQNCKLSDIPYTYAISCRNGTTKFNVNNCVVDSFTYGGIIVLNGANEVHFTNNKVYNAMGVNYPNTYPISLGLWDGEEGYNTCNNTYAIGNYVKCNAPHWEGIETHGGKNVVISNNIIEGCLTGIALAGGQNSLTCDNCTITDNVLIGPNTTGTSKPSQNTGIVASYASNTIIANNSIKGYAELANHGYARYSIFVPYSNDIIISNNVIEGGITSDGFDAYGIYIAYSEHVRVNDNEAYNGTNTSFIRLVNSNNCYISNNTIKSFSTYFVIGPNSYTKPIVNKLFNNNYDVTFVGSNWKTIIPDRLDGAPESGEKNDVIINESPTVGQPKGWICTTSETANDDAVWVSLGNL